MAVPSAPTNVLLQQGNGSTFLSWDLTPTATSYSVQRSTDGITFAGVGTPTPNSYLDTTVVVGTQYFYQVAGVNGSGTGAYTASNPTSIVPALVGQMSLGEIRLRAQQRADRVNSNFVTVTEWNYYINQSYYELYDLLITVYEDYYVAPRLTITTTGVQFYDLPNGQNYTAAPALYKLFGVDCGIANNTNAFSTLKKFDFISRNRYVYPQLTSTLLGVLNLEYRLVGSQIMFIPVPSSGQPIGLWYFPRLKVLLQDTDIMDGISGWTEYVIVDAARKALAKEESDTSVLENEKMRLRLRIEESAVNRDAGQPDTVSDTRLMNSSLGGSPWDGAWGGY